MFFRKILFFLVFLPVGVCVAQTPDSTEKDLFINPPEARPLNLDSIRKLIRYPDSLANAPVKIQGKVFIRVLVDKTGHVTNHMVKKSPHPLISAEVVKHIYALRFTPAVNNNQPIKVWMSIPFDIKPN